VNEWKACQTPLSPGYSNLTGFTDWSNQGLPGVVWLTSRVYSADRLPGTWHWPDGSPSAVACGQLPPPSAAEAVETSVNTETTGRSESVTKGESTDTVSEQTEEDAPAENVVTDESIAQAEQDKTSGQDATA
jgi:hypothetical protein